MLTANKANYEQARNTFNEIKYFSGLPYRMSFEGGIDHNWEMKKSNEYGRISVNSENDPYDGIKHLTMDTNTEYEYVTNEAGLHLDLFKEDRVMLEFWWKEFFDESDPEDGVYFSDDGGDSFVKVYDLTGTVNNEWIKIELDVDELALIAGLSYTDDFVIKFQQRDNYSIASDGFAFDDIYVYSNYAQFPYETGFENDLDEYWETESSNIYGRIQTTGEHEPYAGSRHLTMDVNMDGYFAINEARLYVDLYKTENVILDFRWKEFNDESHQLYDGIFFSDNAGENFIKVYDLDGEHSEDNTWQEVQLSVTELADQYRLKLSPKFVIKFQQADDEMITNAGFTFDEIIVIDNRRNLTETTESEIKAFTINNSPNPFVHNTTINYSLPEEKFIEIQIYNIKGQLVKELVNEIKPAGSFQIDWNGKDTQNRLADSGIYFYKLSTADYVSTKKMILLR